MIAELSYLDDASPAAPVDDWFDEASRLPGPAFWETVLSTEAARWARYHRPVTIVLVEIVGLAGVTRVWGRDVALRSAAEVGRTLRSDCRASDYLVRLDEARFAVVLTETDEIAAINMVERVRISCERTLQRVAEDARIAFGWASPSGSLSLVRATRRAEERLRREAGAG